MKEPVNATENKRIAINTLFLYIRLVFVLLISLYTSRIILRNLGVLDYGIYNVVAGFVSMFALLNASLSNVSQRFYNYEKGKNGEKGMQRVFITAHYIQFVIVLLILIVSETIGLWYVVNKMVYPIESAYAVQVVYQSSVVALIFVVLQIPYSSAIIANEKINYYAIVSVFDVLLKLLIAFVIPFIPIDRLTIYGILVASVAVIDFLFYCLYARSHFSYLRFNFNFSRETFSEMLKFSGWSTMNAFSQTIKNQGLNLLINFFFGPVVNAARGISYQVKSALLGFVMNITTASQPQVVESYAKGNVERSKRLVFTISKISFFSLYIVALPIMVEVNFVLNIWLGNEIPDFTEIFTILVLVITLVDILSTPIGMYISASGKVARFNFWNSVIGVSVLPIAYVFLKEGLGPVYVYVISFLISIVMYMVSLVVVNYETDIKIFRYVREVLCPIALVIISTFFFPLIISKLLIPGLIRFVAVLIISVISVTVSIFFIGLDNREKEMICSYSKRIWQKISFVVTK